MDNLPSLPDLGANGGFYAVVLGVLLIGALVRRVPVIGTAMSIVTWLLVATALFVALDQRGRLDPYLSEIGKVLKLDRQEVVGQELRIRMAPDGHFWANVRLGGVERRMLVDSGATVTAISAETAAAAGIAVQEPVFPLLIRTANGTISAQTGTLDEMRLGNVVARKLTVVVSPAFGEMDVLGMNFLSRLRSWRVEGSTLILTPHHPQAAG